MKVIDELATIDEKQEKLLQEAEKEAGKGKKTAETAISEPETTAQDPPAEVQQEEIKNDLWYLATCDMNLFVKLSKRKDRFLKFHNFTLVYQSHKFV